MADAVDGPVDRSVDGSWMTTASSTERVPKRLRLRYKAFRHAHGYKPWKYYAGRERWTRLPDEFKKKG